ncbi:YihY/virulence factor BrkB family protein [Raineyella sp. W15-4]|uniref:YihY/virulence factor BrkB family protein n=1 Tax=Raineyella sp. W15-4 TaxID=3081651 RepID=UPI002953F704|nr:YihY/virulence factor BrkB family protein [Raineyella sp. W15-4]WOQ15501.1 YihY/virulence factor BrkB family protein [Raineyella sp. W15-4]
MVHMPGAGPVGPGRRGGLPAHDPLPRTWGDLHGHLWWYAVRRSVDGVLRLQCVDLAAALTFYAVLALVPAFMVVVDLVSFVGMDERTVDLILYVLTAVAPAGVANALAGPLRGFADSGLPPVTLVVVVLFTVTTASLYLGALARMLNRVYEVMEGRRLLVLPPLQYLTTLALVVAAALAAVLLIAGPAAVGAVGVLLGIPGTLLRVWNALRWPALVVVSLFAAMTVYRTAPNVRHEGTRWLVPGAVVAVGLGAVASWVLTVYAARAYVRLDLNYGTLSGIIVLLMWLWVCNLALIIGGVLNAELARARRLAAGLPAEDDQLTPPIDTRRSSAFSARRRSLVLEGRRHRTAGRR